MSEIEESQSTKTAVEAQVSEILRPTLHDNDFLQSFVRIDLEDTNEEKRMKSESLNSKDTLISDRTSRKDSEKVSQRTTRGVIERKQNHLVEESLHVEMKKQRTKKKRRRRSEIALRHEEIYTDKDRAAAVNMGSRDIKQSLKIKRQQDRTKALHISDETDSNTMLALGNREMRCGNVAIAINCINKALNLSPNDKKALIARSKCHLLLGKPDEALQDAEAALEGKLKDIDKSSAIYCKAEALYHLGDFEMSLVYYYRGMRIRPEFDQFRLGVQKAKEAILSILNKHPITVPPQGHFETFSNESRITLGVKTPVMKKVTASEEASHSFEKDNKEQGLNIKKEDVREKTKRSMTAKHKKSEPNLLGQLNVDKKYLQNLLKRPDIKAAHQDSAQHITMYAEEGITFLKARQHFWRQQRATH